MDIYRISVAIAMSSNHNAVLSALAAHLAGVQGRVNQLTGGFNRLKLAIGGALSLGAGIAILETMTKLVEKTKDYSDELVKLERLGGGMGEAAASGEIAKRAFDISQRVPMKVTDLMKIPGASYSILGQEDSMKIWESLARFSFVMQSQKDFKGDAGKDMQDFLRASELTGRLTDPTTHKAAIAELERFLDLSSKVMAATHNMVTPQTMLGMAKQGGFTMRGLTDEGFMTQAIMAQAMGGPRAGTALLSLWQQMAGGTMFKRTAEGMQELGLLKSDEWGTDHGRVILTDAASKRLTGLVGKDPMDLAANLIERFKAQGITDPEDQMRKVMRALGRQTTQRYTAEEVTNFHQMLAERDRMKQGMGAEGSFGTLMGKSVGANLEALKNAWENLLMAVAGPNSGQVIEILQTLTGALNSMQSSVRSMNPDTLMRVAEGIGILGIALTGAGAAALLAALGPAGWVAGLAIGLGAAAAAFPALRDKLMIIPTALNQSIDFVINAVATAGTRISEALSKLGQAILDALSKLGPDIGKVPGELGIDKGGSGTSPGKTGKPWHPTSFDPGTDRTKATQTAFSLNIDGRTLAQNVIEQMEYITEHATGAPAYNGQSHFGRADSGMAAV